MKLNDFFNDGFGWACRHCAREAAEARTHSESDDRSRLLTEGESESKTPELANSFLAKWADPAHRYLICPRCGIRELADIT